MSTVGCAAVFLACAISVAAQTMVPTPAEQRTSKAFEAARKLGTPALYAFLTPMPKGADLHMHLSGAIYAETFLRDAVKQELCVDDSKMTLDKPMAKDGKAVCAAGELPASSVLAGPAIVDKAKNLSGQGLYDALVDAFSMRGFVPTPGVTGHDQFFATFARFGAAKNPGEWLDEVATRAAAQNEQYLEIMQTPSFGNAAALGYKLGWPADATESVRPEELAQLRTALLALGLKNEVSIDSKELADAKADRKRIEGCDAAVSGKRASACDVQIHWLYQVLRAFPPQQVFAQTLLGFEVASADPDVVGINFVQPEDDRRAMADYHLQMQMLDYLHSVYPKVKISLHAGELAPGLVPPEGMKFHIREAIDLGHASRIGHGVDVMYEKNAPALLKQMADDHIMVEINLTSNDGILGVKGSDHPLHSYLAAHVPVALSTDDEGVNRSDLTREYVKAAEEQGIGYVELKRMARTSLEHAFLAGDSLWEKQDDFTRRRSVCAAPITVIGKPSDACLKFTSANEKAAMEYEMERRFAEFEASVK
jgi:adenosine deaminase